MRMRIYELLIIGVSLSMDAFAVSMCRGLEMRKFNPKHATIIALFFGAFQAIMPVIGYYAGTLFESYITSIDHWVAFGLLAFLGGKMIFDGVKEYLEEKKQDKKEDPTYVDKLNIKKLFVMAIATSIDALAVGITFAFLDTNIWVAISIIGSITFALCFLGVFIGNRVGTKFKNQATIAGGVVLILIGVKILLEHLGIINF